MTHHISQKQPIEGCQQAKPADLHIIKQNARRSEAHPIIYAVRNARDPPAGPGLHCMSASAPDKCDYPLSFNSRVDSKLH